MFTENICICVGVEQTLYTSGAHKLVKRARLLYGKMQNMFTVIGLGLAMYAEQEDAEIEFVPMPEEEKARFRHKTKADLTNLKATIGKRQWLNVFEYLAQ